MSIYTQGSRAKTPSEVQMKPHDDSRTALNLQEEWRRSLGVDSVAEVGWT